jgi:signal recognition particle receptor subunit beta
LTSFLDDLERITETNYKPTNQDILQVRHVTQSVSDTIFEIDGLKIHFYDVSGLKHHRKQWVPYFDNVTSILFVVALSSYDQTMAEDETVNRMADAIVLFEQIANHPLLSKPDLMIFFNKRDIYEKKVGKSWIQKYFPEYSGKTGSISQGYHFFKEKFLAQSKVNRSIFTHLTCCTDTKTMTKIVQALMYFLLISAGVIKRDFQSAGIVQ